MSKLIEYILRKAKNNTTLKNVYHSTVNTYINSNISEITPLNPRESSRKDKRINLLVPSINKEHLFGGISTAIHFFDELVNAGDGYSSRIITADACPAESDLERFQNFKLLSWNDDSEHLKEIVPFNDRYNKTIPVGKDDIFIATSWWTAYAAQRIAQWQSEVYKQEIKKVIYFIQDYEPGFYPWSSQYALAESTYNYKGPQIAIFNSSLLMNYFNDRGYSFTEKYYFEPKLNKALKDKLVPIKEMNKKKKILIYGRPSVARNAFTLIIEALRLWVWVHPGASEWEIISAGEKHNDIDIGNSVRVISKGKMTLDEYAEELKETSVGVSLMISPHPSYPPLEMAHFGALVITNSYANKDLSKVHSGITSLDNLSPDAIAKELSRICRRFEDDNTITSNTTHSMDEYLSDNEQFSFINEILEKL